MSFFFHPKPFVDKFGEVIKFNPIQILAINCDWCQCVSYIIKTEGRSHNVERKEGMKDFMLSNEEVLQAEIERMWNKKGMEFLIPISGIKNN